MPGNVLVITEIGMTMFL